MQSIKNLSFIFAFSLPAIIIAMSNVPTIQRNVGNNQFVSWRRIQNKTKNIQNNATVVKSATENVLVNSKEVKNDFVNRAKIDFTWNVVIESVERLGLTFLCSGVVIEPKIVLTSASCFKDKTPEQIRIRDGDGKLQKIKAIIRHPDFIEKNYHHDIALVALVDNLKVRKIPVFFQDVDFKTFDEQDSGFATTSWNISFKLNNERISPDKFVDITPIISDASVHEKNTQCEQKFRRFFNFIKMDMKKFFPKGIDNSLICVDMTEEELQLINRGQQLMLLIPSPLPPSTMNEDAAVNPILLGTRAQIKSVLKGEDKSEDGPLPALYTDISFYDSWIKNVTTHIDLY